MVWERDKQIKAAPPSYVCGCPAQLAMAVSNLADFEAHARDRLNKDVCNFYSTGADQEQTLRDNVEAFKRCTQPGHIIVLNGCEHTRPPFRYRLRPRVLRDVSQLDMRVKLLGEWVDFPICVAPTACHKYIHPDGEVATARGKAEHSCFFFNPYRCDFFYCSLYKDGYLYGCKHLLHC